MSLRELVVSRNYITYPHLAKPFKERLKCLSKIDDIDETIKLLESRSKRVVQYMPQSDIADSHMGDGAIEPATMIQHEVILDVGGAAQHDENAGVSYVSNIGQMTNKQLDNFFSRPVLIDNGTLPVGSQSDIRVSLWDLYTLNPIVRSKLRNYAYLKANIHLRVVLSGTPFHFGKVLVSPQPYPIKNENIVSYGTAIGTLPAMRSNFLNYLSQAPGAFVMDVRDNKPSELMIPFICHKQAFRLYNTDDVSIGTATSYEDLDEALDVFIYTINAVNCTQTGATDVGYYLYAWLSDVELGCPTATSMAIATQSDERKTGPVERIASRALSVTSAMTEVPYIAPFAKASTYALTALKGISSIFGWSKPIDEGKPALMKNMAYQNGSLTVGWDTNYRVVMDPKQELSIGAQAAGSAFDDMVIAHIASIESYLTSFDWDPADVYSANLFTCAITPMLSTVSSDINGDYIQPSAMAFAVKPFSFWRGDIKIRLEIVCSQFHRGKLLIVYEPNFNQGTTIGSASVDFLKQYTMTVDIQETQDVEFCVDWASYRSWLPVQLGSYASYGSTYTTTDTDTGFNGYIRIVPLTQLQAPNADPIHVNVYVSCENLNVNYFSMGFDETRVLPQSAVKPVTCSRINPTNASVEHLSDEVFGEQPKSFRNLLKRYMKHLELSSVTAVAAPACITLYSANPPSLYSTYGTATAVSNLYEYLRYAYLGMKGGMRYRVNLQSALEDIHQNQVKVSNSAIRQSTSNSLSIAATNGTQALALSRGSVTFMPHSNAGIEYELATYTPNLYLYSFADDFVGSNPGGYQNMSDSWNYRPSVEIECASVTGPTYVYQEIATGEDFSFLRFQGAPFYSNALAP